MEEGYEEEGFIFNKLFNIYITLNMKMVLLILVESMMMPDCNPSTPTCLVPQWWCKMYNGIR